MAADPPKVPWLRSEARRPRSCVPPRRTGGRARWWSTGRRLGDRTRGGWGGAVAKPGALGRACRPGAQGGGCGGGPQDAGLGIVLAVVEGEQGVEFGVGE